MSGSGFIREPVTVIGPDGRPSDEQRRVYEAVKQQMGDAVAAIVGETQASAVTAHTLLFQQLGLALCVLDLDAADKFMDAMRRNLVAGVSGDRSGVGLADMADAGQRLEDAFELHTRDAAGKA